MLDETKLAALQALANSLSLEEVIWASGYLAGISNSKESGTSQKSRSKITFAYATETGNSRKLAADFTNQAKLKGIQARLVNLEQYRFQELLREEYFFTVISTHGEGDPPLSAEKFFTNLSELDSNRLTNLKYSVLALGDSAYPLFCKAGEKLDDTLDNLGALQLVSLRRCDTDYKADADAWFNELIYTLNQSPALETAKTVPITKKQTGKNYFLGSIGASFNLNDTGSTKHTRHIEITAAEADYHPGDSLGMIPNNPRPTVNAILELTGAAADKIHQHRKATGTLIDLLENQLNILHLSENVVDTYGRHTGHDIPRTRIGLVDLLKIYPVSEAAQFEEFIHFLEGITPRLYSISSSPEAHPGEVHLTVARDVYHTNGEEKYGHCSDLLISLAKGDAIRFYIHRNEAFRLPSPETDIIMIGPGTGIAPFRSFLWEREATNATGKNWLFFGDRNFTTDFLYQTELQNFSETGLLTRVNTAFSRDQAQKRYVQHRILEQGAELYKWIQRGASLYMCGSRDPMSVDVEKALVEVFTQQGTKNLNDGTALLNHLKESGRFHKDVY